jgi:glycosyltransferase involved in cell wall biosynthesis
MPALLAAVDVLVHAGVGEGFPVAVQEAMAAGVPVAILWEEGYVSSVSREALEAVDRLEDLWAALGRLVRDPARRRELSARARCEAQSRWSWASTAGHYERLFLAAGASTAGQPGS